MDKLKEEIKILFEKQLSKLNLTSSGLTHEILELKLNSIVETISSKVDISSAQSIPLYHTSNDNINLSSYDIESGKSDDIVLRTNYTNHIPAQSLPSTISTSIPLDLTLSYEMKQYAKSKFIRDPEDVFEDFKLYYESKGTLNSNWDAVWKKWVKNQNKYKTHLVKTVIDEDMILTQLNEKFAQDYIDKDNIQIEFIKFKNHYLSTGDIKVSWGKVWENWCIKHKQFKPKENTKAKEKSDYRWDFYKAKEQSDKIKDWLDFEMKIDWLNDHYYKDLPIFNGKIGWQKVKHADFNKDEILLYKVESDNGSFMIQHKTDDIIDAEVLEND